MVKITIAKREQEKRKGFMDKIIGGLHSMDRGLDKMGFTARINPLDMVGGAKKINTPQPQMQGVRPYPRQELVFCPVCNGWVPTPHRHKVIEE